jgi:hypothetical protein
MNPKKFPNATGAIAMEGRDSQHKYLESLIRADYERCHPDDNFDDLKWRAHFTKEDKGLLRDWLTIAEWRERMPFASETMIAAE